MGLSHYHSIWFITIRIYHLSIYSSFSGTIPLLRELHAQRHGALEEGGREGWDGEATNETGHLSEETQEHAYYAFLLTCHFRPCALTYTICATGIVPKINWCWMQRSSNIIVELWHLHRGPIKSYNPGLGCASLARYFFSVQTRFFHIVPLLNKIENERGTLSRTI